MSDTAIGLKFNQDQVSTARTSGSTAVSTSTVEVGEQLNGSKGDNISIATKIRNASNFNELLDILSELLGISTDDIKHRIGKNADFEKTKNLFLQNISIAEQNNNGKSKLAIEENAINETLLRLQQIDTMRIVSPQRSDKEIEARLAKAKSLSEKLDVFYGNKYSRAKTREEKVDYARRYFTTYYKERLDKALSGKKPGTDAYNKALQNELNIQKNDIQLIIAKTTNPEDREIMAEALEALAADNRYDALLGIFRMTLSSQEQTQIADMAFGTNEQQNRFLEGMKREDVRDASATLSRTRSNEVEAKVHEESKQERDEYEIANKEIIDYIKAHPDEVKALYQKNESELTDRERKIIAVNDRINNFYTPKQAGEISGNAQNENRTEEFLNQLHNDARDLSNYSDVIAEIQEYAKAHEDELPENFAQLVDKATNGNYTRALEGQELDLSYAETTVYNDETYGSAIGKSGLFEQREQEALASANEYINRFFAAQRENENPEQQITITSQSQPEEQNDTKSQGVDYSQMSDIEVWSEAFKGDRGAWAYLVKNVGILNATKETFTNWDNVISNQAKDAAVRTLSYLPTATRALIARTFQSSTDAMSAVADGLGRIKFLATFNEGGFSKRTEKFVDEYRERTDSVGS